jgi:alpha-glucosidase (family GH31 glycosyl hydrolase)
MQGISVDGIVLDFMDRRRVFTIDPDYFPMNRMQEIVAYLHAHDQKFGAYLFLLLW